MAYNLKLTDKQKSTMNANDATVRQRILQMLVQLASASSTTSASSTEDLPYRRQQSALQIFQQLHRINAWTTLTPKLVGLLAYNYSITPAMVENMQLNGLSQHHGIVKLDDLFLWPERLLNQLNYFTGLPSPPSPTDEGSILSWTTFMDASVQKNLTSPILLAKISDEVVRASYLQVRCA